MVATDDMVSESTRPDRRRRRQHRTADILSAQRQCTSSISSAAAVAEFTDHGSITTDQKSRDFDDLFIDQCPVIIERNADQQRAVKQGTDGSVTGFLYDYKRLLCETDTVGGAISQTYASDTTDEFGDLIGEDGQYIHQYDAQANTNALLDETGTVAAQYKYLAFGQVSAVSIDGGPWTAEDWESLPLDFTSNMLAGGKKQYYLDQEIALYLLGSGNNGRYYDAATGRFLSEDPTKQDGTSKDSNSQLLTSNSSPDINLYCYTGNNPINNLDPSGHSLVTDPPKQVYHPVQNQPTQQHNANVHSNAPATGHGTTSSGSLAGAERNIVRQTDAAREGVLKGEAPKAGQWLAGPGPDAGKQDTPGYTPAQLQIIHTHLEKLFHNGPAMQYVNYGRSPVYDSWIAQAQGAQARTGQSSGWPFARTHNQRDIAQTPTVKVDGVNMPTNVAQNSAAALDAVQASIDQAIAAGDFKRAEYLSAHEFDVPTTPVPQVKLPPGASLIPGAQNLANIHADWMTGHYSTATRNLKLGIASLGMAMIFGALGREMDVRPGTVRDVARIGRLGKQARLRQLVSDPNVSSADRGWIRQEMNAIQRGNRPTIRVPPGKTLAHLRGFPAKKGFGYKYANLQDPGLNKLQHKYEGY